MTFIIQSGNPQKRAAAIVKAVTNYKDARMIAKIAAARYGSQLGLAFHPELTGNPEIHRYFIEEICGR